MVDVEILGAKTAVTEMERPKNITVVLEKILFEVNLYLARYMRGAAAVSHISQLPLNTQHKFHPQVVSKQNNVSHYMGGSPPLVSVQLCD